MNNIVTNLMNEYICYGGMAYKRYEVYRLALEATGDKRAADFFAFSDKKPPTGDELEYCLKVRELVEAEDE